MISSKPRLTALCGSLLALLSASSFAGGNFIIDLTHPIPTFQPMEGDPMKPDMSKPWLDSQAIPSFGQQTVLSIGQFPTNQGHFDLGTLVLSEHHGTHMDSSAHYVNNSESMEEGNPTARQRKYMHMLDGEDLSGPIVLVDISARVQAELDKNGGAPSPDTSVTDFSDTSGNAVTADDIRACIACNHACIGHRRQGFGVSCIQYPETGRELEYGCLRSAERRRRCLKA